MNTRSQRRRFACLVAMAIGLVVHLFGARDAEAIPSFARKYQASCITCHTVFPMLNSFGEAFRRNGYRFPSKNGSLDSDAIKAPQIPMGQEEYKKTFPKSVWPSQIVEAVPLSVMVNGGVVMNVPGSDAHDAAGNVFTWNGIFGEAHLFGAGAFSDTLTYFTQLTLTDGGIDLETGYLLWNDIVGPDHLVNLWIGRLFAPQLTSYGLHSSYLSDSYMPSTSIAGLYNPTGTMVPGQGHSDGIELNGIAAHRLGYSMGWLASESSVAGLKLRNAEELYAHVGFKIGGVSLDGEGASSDPPDPAKPWAETSLTIDAFGYHGMTAMDNGTNAPTAMAENDKVDTLGGSLHLNLGSLVAMAGAQVERHNRPYPGTAPTAANPPAQSAALPGVPDFTAATAWSQWNEIDYVIFPWFVPGVRTEYVNVALETGGVASLTRIMPGIATAVRPNVKLTVIGDIEYAHGMPPVGSWDPAGGSVLVPTGGNNRFQAEKVMGTFAWAF